MSAQSCPICGKPAASGFRSRNGFDIAGCRACGHRWTQLQRSIEPGEELYPAFEQSQGVLPSLRRWVFGIFLRDRIRLARWARPSGRLLDFGCGSGSFAKAAQRAGYEATGLEPFSLLVERDHAPRLVKGGLQELGDADGFDLVTAWHVIEHLDDPQALLRQLRQHLAVGGRLLVCVPNIESWQGRVFKDSWFHLDPPRHLHHFSQQSLTRALSDAGLQPVGWRWWVPEYGLSGWVQSVLNRYMRESNVLYEAVKDRKELGNLTPGRRRALVAASLAAAIPLATAALPVEAVAAWRRASATLTVVAEAR